MVRIFFILKAQGLLHIDFLFDRTVQESTLDVYVKKA
jgi:hypothetical protein